MTLVNTFLVLVLVASSVQHSSNKQFALVHAASQDAAHYALPPNIYDNIPAGLTTPTSFRTYPTATPTSPVQQRDAPALATTTDGGPTGFDITAPLLNSLYTPGSGLMVTWSNREVAFLDSWVAPQAIMDLIIHDANFSNSSLLTKEDMRNLAKMKVQDLRATQQANVMKDSVFLLKSLRLLSWPLLDSDIGDETRTTMTDLSAKILSDPGFNLLKSVNNSSTPARLTILGSSGGALLWTIPADWEYEGEFQIEISTAAGTPGQHTTRSFWILRDAVTRKLVPQYNLPSMAQQQQAIFEAAKVGGRAKEEIQRQRDMGVFLGVAAMMSAFVLVGLGVVVGMYRRKWAAQEAAAAANRGSGSFPSSRRNSSSNLESATTPIAACCAGTSDGSIKRTLSLPTTARSQYLEYTSSSCGILTRKKQQSLLDPLQGDEDAHSPKDLNLSEETLRGVIIKSHDDNDEDDDEKKAIESNIVVDGSGGEGGGVSATTPVDESFVELPLYESGNNDSTSTLANEKHS
ncbi:hypothetical protein BGZ97_003640 [Linnemannia gamsii]|jgi:hypothetical protein|uniref:Uncharacterized protein n=1 Tax=Linnemannia gamsii TaxID=64522 RepID=A0A9P6QVD6_9FUNG|nr:hypothetical protein BGZ97_003640 [Linnemannia gamsii]